VAEAGEAARGCTGVCKKILRGEFGRGREGQWDRTFPIWRKIVSRQQIKAKILSRRKIPLGDPRIKNMNDTQWVFELESMNLEDEHKFNEIKSITTMIKDGAIGLLGLGGMPIEDEETGLLRQMKSGEFVPLSLIMGRDDVLQMVMEKQEEFRNQEEQRKALELEGFATGGRIQDVDVGVSEMTPDELEEFMQGDEPEFENTPEELKKMMEWGSPETQSYLENLVLNKDDIEENSTEPQRARTIGKARRDLIQQVNEQKKAERDQEPVVMPIKVESDSVLEQTPEKKAKARITVETVED
jgi:hypothetical protein